MPQLDFSTLSVVLFSLLISAIVYYLIFSVRLLPDVIILFKFRTKKLLKKNSINLNSIFLPNFFSYNVAVRKKN